MAGGAVSREEGEEGEEGEGDVWWRWMGGEKRSETEGPGGGCLGGGSETARRPARVPAAQGGKSGINVD